LWICDTPGLKDSRGISKDIANGVGMINALKECNSLKFALVLPKDSLFGDRMTGVIEISKTIANLFT